MGRMVRIWVRLDSEEDEALGGLAERVKSHRVALVRSAVRCFLRLSEMVDDSVLERLGTGKFQLVSPVEIEPVEE